MNVFRITRYNSRTPSFSGDGAKLFNGRYNPLGTPVVYTSDHSASAMLEILVHLNKYAQLVKIQHYYYRVAVEDAQIQDLSEIRISKKNPVLTENEQLGLEWVKAAQKPFLRVPSALAPEAWNLILNPMFPNWENTCTIEGAFPVTFDSRFMK